NFYDENLEIYPGDVLTRNFKTFELNNLLKLDIGGWNAKLGFLYQFEDMARFGATVQFPKTFTVKEEFSVSGVSEFGSSSITRFEAEIADEVAYDIVTPFELTGAFAVNLKGIILSAEATFIDYSQLK